MMIARMTFPFFSVSHTAFFKRQPVIDFLCQVMIAGSGRDPYAVNRWTGSAGLDPRACLGPAERRKFNVELKGGLAVLF